MKQSYLIAFGALMLAACGAEQAEEAESVRVSALPRPEQPAGNGFSSPGEGIAIVNGSQAASIDISLPANLDELDEALAKTLRERVNAGQAGFLEGGGELGFGGARCEPGSVGQLGVLELLNHTHHAGPIQGRQVAGLDVGRVDNAQRLIAQTGTGDDGPVDLLGNQECQVFAYQGFNVRA